MSHPSSVQIWFPGSVATGIPHSSFVPDPPTTGDLRNTLVSMPISSYKSIKFFSTIQT